MSYRRSPNTFLFLALKFSLLIIASSWMSVPQAADGAFDGTFGTQGRTTFSLSLGQSDYADAAQPTSDGKVLMAGSCSASGCVARVTSNGTLDPTYGPLGLGYLLFDTLPGIPFPSNVYDMAVLPDGRVALVGCSGDEQTGAIYVVKADGSNFDTSLGNGKGYLVGTSGSASTPECPYGIRRQSNGMFVVMNEADLPSYGQVMLVARFKADLSGVDTSFGTNGYVNLAFGSNGASGNNDIALTLSVQPDDKIIVAGTSVFMGASTMAIARLLPDGQLDTSFGSGSGRFYYAGSGQSSQIESVALDAQGRIVVGGSMSRGGVIYQMLARLTGGGVLDTTFNGGVVTFQSAVAGNQNIASVYATANQIFAAASVPARGGAGTLFDFSVFDNNGKAVSSFGGNGHFSSTFGASTPSNFPNAVFATSSGVIIAGTSGTAANPDFGAARLTLDYVFGDSFE